MRRRRLVAARSAADTTITVGAYERALEAVNRQKQPPPGGRMGILRVGREVVMLNPREWAMEPQEDSGREA